MDGGRETEGAEVECMTMTDEPVSVDKTEGSDRRMKDWSSRGKKRSKWEKTLQVHQEEWQPSRTLVTPKEST